MADEPRDEVPTEDIDRELARAEQMLQDARTAHEVGISKATVVNRLYFACFHAAQAALYSRGHNPQSHGQLRSLLGSELILEGVVERQCGRFLNDIATYRRRVDYGSGGVERPAAELIDGTTAFLDSMRRVVDEARR